MIPIIEVEAILYSSTGVALLVDTSSGAQAVRLVGAEGLGVTTKDESGEYGAGARSLDVNVRSSIGHVRLTGANLQYETMTTDQALTNGVYDTVYNNTSTGQVLWTRCVVTNNDVNIKVTVDDNIVINDFNLQELYKDYAIDTADPSINGMDFIHTEKQGKIIVLTFPSGIEFSNYFKIELKANQTGIYMSRGLVVWVQE